MRLLSNRNRREPDTYTEAEAAHRLGISVDRLHKLLDENVFNDGSKRPSDVQLQGNDLILLEFWNRSTENPKVVRMPNPA
jgi:hypothetical protein